ncbi:MAG TPA: Ig-like domain repeat protein [Gemmataceae bacterium]|nr:Ig-like domain repeat protein [Gemmataceae bacterium]
MKPLSLQGLLRRFFRPASRMIARRRTLLTLERLEDRAVPTATITAITGNNGPIGGGTEIAVTGTDFLNTTEVYFGAYTAMYSIVSDTQMNAWSPSQPAGAVDITVATPDGTSPTSAADVFQYNITSSTTSLTSSANPASYGNSVTFTAAVGSAGSNGMFSPTGTVSFFDNGVLLGTSSVTSGWSGSQATYTTSALALGSHSITAVYSGDLNFGASTSSALTQNVTSGTAYV